MIEATVPRTETGAPPMTIVVGYVPAPEGTAALERAIVEAKNAGEKLLVLHSATLPREAAAEVSVEQSVDALDEELAGQLAEHEVVMLGADADPGDAILDAAASADASLIVIGLRRRTPVGKLLLGSNSQRVLLGADCPVLAVKAPGQH